MHELSLVVNILEIAQEQMRNHRARDLEEIELEIGQLAGVEMEAFTFAWDAAVMNTPLQQTRRIIHEIPGKAICLLCDREFITDQLYSPCPECGDYLNELIQGKELRIKSLVVN